jgi:hypothetical protein
MRMGIGFHGWTMRICRCKGIGGADQGEGSGNRALVGGGKSAGQTGGTHGGLAPRFARTFVTGATKEKSAGHETVITMVTSAGNQCASTEQRRPRYKTVNLPRPAPLTLLVTDS